MPRATNVATQRIELRLPAEQKTVIARAAALERLDVTGFILRAVLPQAKAVVDREERMALSERDSLRVLDLLEHPPEPAAALLRAAKADQSAA